MNRGNKNAGNMKDCHFSKDDQIALEKMFKELAKKNISEHMREEKLKRTQFRDVLHSKFKMTDDVMMDRILRAFDKDNDACINLDEWISGLSVFLKGTLEEQIEFCFKVYDLNSDGYISREEMFQLLKTSMVKQPTEEDPEEGIKDLVEISIKKMDKDHDGRLSFNDFRESIIEDNLLVECLGTCLPDQKCCDRFLEICRWLHRGQEDQYHYQLLTRNSKTKKTRSDSSDESCSDEDDENNDDDYRQRPKSNNSRSGSGQKRSVSQQKK